MSSPFNIKKTTQVGRNGFDLSQRHLFGACCGMLLPIMHEETLPGDSFKLRLDSFTRMRPLNTAAFARFKENFDFYWCSKDTLWPYYNSMVVNNNEPQAMPVVSQTNVPQELPSISLGSLTQHFYSLRNTIGDMGANRESESAILFDFLGLGSYWSYVSEASSTSPDTLVSLLPWCLYQRIYADFYRYPHWERRDVVSYNLRNFYNSVNRLSGSSIAERTNMFKMRYANWRKDYFMGLYPSQQFGDVSVIPIYGNGNIQINSDQQTSSQPAYWTGNGNLGVNGSYRRITLQTPQGDSNGIGTSIIDLRRAQALQRLKEVTMTNGSSMYQQVKAHYGFELPEGRKDAPQFIGSFDNVVTINDVDATAAGSDGNTTTMAGQTYGKATAASDLRKTIDFTAKDFGYIMCIYHVEPLLEYDACGIKRSNLKLSASDEFIPEFDKIGFGSITAQELIREGLANLDYSRELGFTSRYLDLKASYDRVHGSFMRVGSQNRTDQSWTVALDAKTLRDIVWHETNSLDWRFFKVNPFITNNLMQVQLNVPDSENPDERIAGYEPFMVSANFGIYKTSNMSVDSLPY